MVEAAIADTQGASLGCPSRLAPPAPGDSFVDPAPFVRRRGDGLARLELAVRGAKCAGCIKKIESGLKALPGVREARLNLSTNKLAVAWDEGALAGIEVTRALDALGYQAAPFDPEAVAAETDLTGRSLLRALAVAGFATANIMLLSVAIWAGHSGEMGPATRDLMHWISALIAVPAASYAGRPFFRSAIAALKAGRANMEVPISLAVVLALGMSIHETLAGGEDAYFDAAVMLLFFLLIGRYLDHRLRAKAREAARELLALQSVAANRLDANGVVTAVSARDLRVGDQIVLAPGDRAPVDGVIESGRTEADVSLITGESAPAPFAPGDQIHAGVVNVAERIVMRATARAEDSLVADLTRLVEAGEQGRGRYVRLADRAARVYVPLVHSLALASFLGWFFIGGLGLRDSAMIAIAVLIITCPCALGLAAPVVQIVATGRLFRAGVLVKSGDALERLSEVDAFVFDKTGTLTLGKPSLLNAESLPPDSLAGAARLARASRHPLSRALVRFAGPGPVAEDLEETPGKGVSGRIDGRLARLGRASWVGADDLQALSDTSNLEMWFAFEGDAPVRFIFEDRLRADAPSVMARLKDRALGLEMLSGDRQRPAAAIAGELGLETWSAELSPHGKIDRLEVRSSAGEKIAMVGDGLNDAPALAAAHVSLSPGTAADASQAAADFVFQGDGLQPVVEAYDVSRKARRRVLENFGLAAAYNAIAVPIAVCGFVTPLIAAIAMSASSVLVTLNALRLTGGRRKA